MAITGFLVSIQIFCNSGFIILTPLVKAISSEMRKSIVSIGIALACGLVITHTMVPATPRPVGVAGIFEVNVGSLIFWGLVLAVPMLIGPILFACWGARKSGRFPRRRATGRVNSFFWGGNRSIGITEGREQLRLYSVASTIAWAIGIVVLLILNALFG